ncbi:MAG: PqqD family protein [Acidobacteriia bacterium]|nr:PqqD family protein [Terriglobia bacterium]
MEWEEDAEGRVTVLVPKFRKGWPARVLQPRLSRPFFRVKLDAFGSFFWKGCDGETSIQTIGEKMKHHFGEEAEPLYDRITRFLQQLENGDLLKIQ